MNAPGEIVERMSRSARPELFDGIAQPEVLISLVLANLMSPSLWEFATRIQEHVNRQNPGRRSDADVLRQVQDYVNAHLYHMAPLEVDDLWGLAPLDEERARLGAARVDYAVDSIVNHLEALRAVGALHPNQDIVPVIRNGLFPQYEYSIVDVIHAHCRHLQRTKHKPFGITSCADETILICALAVALRLIPFSSIVLMGAPVHYTALLEVGNETQWINAKKECFDREDWRKLVFEAEGKVDPDAIQQTFDARADLDRVITPCGEAIFPERRSTVAQQDLENILNGIEAFFGTRLRQLAGIAPGSIGYDAPEIPKHAMLEIDRAQDADTTRQAVHALTGQYPGTAIEQSLYGYRDLSVRHPEAYLVAASRGRRLRSVAAGCRSIDEAIGQVRAIAGNESIFGDADRIALPDEVILFGTGTARDKSLLLLGLIVLAEAIPAAIKRDCEVVLTEGQSYVRTGPDWWMADRWEKACPPAEPAVVRWTGG